jgi:two-component system, OmpR family, response regulator
MVLDVMLPDFDGFETCRRLHSDGVWVPIINRARRDRGSGARPRRGRRRLPGQALSLAELLARLRALARRGTFERPTVVEAGELRLDPATRPRGHAGSGLGLAIVRAVAGAHGGRVVIVPGRGATVRVWLPGGGPGPPKRG